MSDEFKLQWSVSLPPSAQYAKGHMMNLRANTVEEMDALLTEFLNSEVIAKATDAAALLVGAQVVVETPASSGASSPPASTGHTCPHGQRVERSGKGAKGPWTGYFCALPKGSAGACDPVWA